MMKCRRRIAVLLAMVALVFLLPFSVLAAGTIDTDRNVSLTISYKYGSTSLSGAKFDLYRVAAVDAQGELPVTEPFSGFHVDIRGKNDDAWRRLASTLESYVLRDNVAVTDSGEASGQGELGLPGGQSRGQPGLYLVTGYRLRKGSYRYEAAPFMVMLPELDTVSNTWKYDVTVSPKYDRERVRDDDDDEEDTITRKVLKVWEDDGYTSRRPSRITVDLLRDGRVYDTVTLSASDNWRYTWDDLDEDYSWRVAERDVDDDYNVTVTREGITFVMTNTYTRGTIKDISDGDTPTGTISDNPIPRAFFGTKLPQTGQLWWPVPVLAAVGLLLIVVGLLRRRGAEHE